MKKLIKLFLFLFVFFGYVSVGQAQPYEGKIIDMFDNKVTVMIEDGHSLKKGEEVSLSYMAGVLEMDIGQYQIVEAPGNLFIAEVVTSNIPPSKQMKVKVYPIAKQEISVIDYQGNTGKMWVDAPSNEGNSPNPAGYDPGGIELLGQRTTGFKDEGKKQPSLNQKVDRSMKIAGEVVRIMGKKIQVEYGGSAMPEIGWAVDLTYVTSQGKELPVGTWKVVNVKGNTLIAEEYDVIGKARMGLKASIYFASLKQGKKTRQPGSKNMSDETQRVENMLMPGDQSNLTKKVKNPLPQWYQESIDIANRKGDGSFPPLPEGFREVNPEDYEKNLPHEPLDYNQVLKNAEKFDGIKRRWMLGVEIQNHVPPGGNFGQGDGVIVVRIQPNSAAARAGLQTGDIIKKIRNIQITNMEHFLTQLQKERQNTYFVINRKGRNLKLQVKLQKI